MKNNAKKKANIKITITSYLKTKKNYSLKKKKNFISSIMRKKINRHLPLGTSLYIWLQQRMQMNKI